MGPKLQSWEKQGQIYSGRAQCPTVLKINESGKEIWRVFIADRNSEGQAFIRYLDLDPENPKNILYEETRSLLQYGPPGSFDHTGQMPTSIIEDTLGDRKIFWLFYIGWSQRLDVPYHNAVGLAYSYDGKTFAKYRNGPIIGTSVDDPFFTGTACVVKAHNTSMMWCYYLSSNGWASDGNKLEPTYRIKEAISGGNIINWSTRPDSEGVVVDFASPSEGGICNATVYYDSNRIKHMWYCYRNKFDYRNNPNNSYRIGYSVGHPPIFRGLKTEQPATWLRQDTVVNLELGDLNRWDSQMLCYPNVIEHQGKLLMFYNGNEFGNTGFGYATLPLTDITSF